jgi:hypothetical protein
MPGCVCDDGFVKNTEGECVTVEQCPPRKQKLFSRKTVVCTFRSFGTFIKGNVLTTRNIVTLAAHANRHVATLVKYSAKLPSVQDASAKKATSEMRTIDAFWLKNAQKVWKTFFPHLNFLKNHFLIQLIATVKMKFSTNVDQHAVI